MYRPQLDHKKPFIVSRCRIRTPTTIVLADLRRRNVWGIYPRYSSGYTIPCPSITSQPVRSDDDTTDITNGIWLVSASFACSIVGVERSKRIRNSISTNTSSTNCRRNSILRSYWSWFATDISSSWKKIKTIIIEKDRNY